jgi:peptidoglycan/xylan/chitin deacetylase (PgdA/CDA1 family)
VRTHALMYHDVVSDDPDSSGFPGHGPASFKLRWEAFTAHLDGIEEEVVAAPALADDLLAAQANARSWSLTFDDGGSSALAVGEELARRGWRAHFFIVTSLIGQRGFVDGSAVGELRSMGHLIGSHSATHPKRMSSLSTAGLREEWRTSVGALSDLLGEQVRIASVPGGFYSGSVADAAADAGILALFTSEPVRTPRRVGACLVVGRLSVRRDTSSDEVARAASGARGPWLRQFAGWNLRKPLKVILGGRYEQVYARYWQLHKHTVRARRRPPGP